MHVSPAATASASSTASSACALVPTNDPTPVEKAAVDGIAAEFGPETFLWISFHRPDGAVRSWFAWTAGGQRLGDYIDRVAMTAGLDAADWLHVADRHQDTRARGTIKTWAYALRPVLADVESGVRSPAARREGLRRVLAALVGDSGQQHVRDVRWLGFGPRVTRRRD
jgi:hypothetical protein